MPKINNSAIVKQRMLTNLILFYRVPAWCKTLKWGKYMKKKLQRQMALKVASVSCTVFTENLLIIAEMIILLAEERETEIERERERESE